MDIFDAAGVDRIDPVFAKAHRWRYARTERPIDEGFVWEPSLGVGVCGDWCRGSRVEDAFLSGFMLADQIAR